MTFKWQTKIMAVNPETGKLAEWGGDTVEAISLSHAKFILDNTGRGYMQLTGNYVDGQVDFKTGKKIDFRPAMFN